MIINALRTDYVERGRYFSPQELYDAGRFAPREKAIFGPIIQLCDEIRRRWGKPIRCSAGVRTPEKQKDLKRRGYKAATYSPHVIGRSAMDLDVSSAAEVRRLVQLVRVVSKDLNIPVRIGWQSYLRAGMSFVHVDCAPLLADQALRQGVIPKWVHAAWSKEQEW